LFRFVVEEEGSEEAPPVCSKVCLENIYFLTFHFIHANSGSNSIKAAPPAWSPVIWAKIPTYFQLELEQSDCYRFRLDCLLVLRGLVTFPHFLVHWVHHTNYIYLTNIFRSNRWTDKQNYSLFLFLSHFLSCLNTNNKKWDSTFLITNNCLQEKISKN